jgi:hypothetical protein
MVPGSFGEHGKLARHLRWAERQSRRLGRSLFHAMIRFGPKLERRQLVLFRAVDIGAELFAVAAACSYARSLSRSGNEEATELADLFCRGARVRVDQLFRQFFGPDDGAAYRVAQSVLRGEHSWLERGAIMPPHPTDRGQAREDADSLVAPARKAATAVTTG